MTAPRIAMPNRVCPECGAGFVAHHGRQRFCQSAHQTAFHGRNKQRGQVLLPLAQVFRMGKRGKTVDRAFAFGEMCRLLDMWNAEDKDSGRRPELVVTVKRRKGWTAADMSTWRG